MTASRDGVVFIAEDWPGAAVEHIDPRYIGHWELIDPPTLLERGPGWTTAELAIAWGVARADIVLVRIGMPGTYYSAGARRDESLPEWPPTAADE